MNYVWTERKAGKEHKCDECGLPIKPGESYCEGVIAGGGLGAIKHPERLHKECKELFAKKERRSDETSDQQK